MVEYKIICYVNAIVNIVFSRIENIMKIIFYLTQILVILFFHSASAKRPVTSGMPVITPWEIGLSTGASIYGTSFNQDANASYSRHSYWRRDVTPGFGLFVVRNISPSIGFEFNWLNTRLKGRWNNSWNILPPLESKEIPLTFNSQVNQFDLMIVFNIDQIMLPGDEEDRGHFFIKTGIGISKIKDNKKFYPEINSAAMSFAFGGGYSYSLNENIKLQVGSILRAVKTDNLDGLHVVSSGRKGEMVEFTKTFEVYSYTYFSVSYSFSDFGSLKSQSSFKRRR